MTAFKYTHNSTHNPYAQASIRSKAGKNYYYNGRLYLQVKEKGVINYVDLSYNLSIKPVSWASNTIDVEIEIKDIEPKDQVIDNPLLENIISYTTNLENIPIYVRIDNKGKIINIFNSAQLIENKNIALKSDKLIIEYLERHPIFSAYICGQISNKINLNSRDFISLASPTIKVISSIKVITRKLKRTDSLETLISSNKILERINSSDNVMNIVDFSTQIIAIRSEKNILPFSLQYSTEEIYDNNVSIYASVGIEQVVTKKDLSLKNKILCRLQSQLGSFF